MTLSTNVEARFDHLNVAGTIRSNSTLYANGLIHAYQGMDVSNGMTVGGNVLFNNETRFKQVMNLENRLYCDDAIFSAGGVSVGTNLTVYQLASFGNCPYTPPVTPSNAATIYLDAGTGKLKVSEHGSAYKNLVSEPFTTYSATTTGSDWTTVYSREFAAGDLKMLRFQLMGVRTDDATDTDTWGMLEFLSGFYVPAGGDTIIQLGAQKVLAAWKTKVYTGTTQPVDVHFDFNGLTWNLQIRSINADQTMAWTIKVYE